MSVADIEYRDEGEGPAVLFVPGSFSTSAAWRPIQRHLPATYRRVGTSLCGYGATAETRTPHDVAMQHEIRVIEAAARRIGEPVHLVGHSFGATVALAAALAGRVAVRSLALFEANPLALIRTGGARSAYDATVQMSRAFEAAVARGERDAAGRVIDFWGGAGAFAAMPDAVRDYCRATAAANALDWRTCLGFEADRDAFAALEAPVLLVRGSQCNDAMREIFAGLEHWLPDVRPAVVQGAGHFLISSHSAECARLLTAFLEDVA